MYASSSRRAALAVIGVTALAATALTLPAQGVAAAPPTCDGRVATIVGTAAGDEIHGTSGRDVIVGRGGGDNIDGHGGNDVICGNRGNDRLEGDGGDDRLYGGRGFDDAEGGPGNDLCVAEQRESC